MRAPWKARLFALIVWLASGAAVGSARAQPEAGAAVGDEADVSGALEPASDEAPGAQDGVGPAESARGDGLDDERARVHFDAGEAYYGAQRFADAAREFALAYELSRRPEMLVNLARAHERDGALRAAMADLELLVAQHPSTSYRGEAEERIARIRATLAAQATAAASPPVRAPTQPGVDQNVAPWRKLRMLTFVLAGGALATAVVALGTGLRAHGLYGSLEEECPADLCAGSFVADRDRGRALARASSGLTFVSVALAAASATSWLVERRSRRRTALTLDVSRQHAGLLLRSRF